MIESLYIDSNIRIPAGQNPSAALAPPRIGTALAATALGIISLAFSWVPFLDGLVIITAMVVSLVALSSAKLRGGAGRGLARADSSWRSSLL